MSAQKRHHAFVLADLPLFIGPAALVGDVIALSELLNGARVEDLDKWGHTASDLARQRHDELAIHLLQTRPDLKH
jgi:hypothetical protein